MWDYANEDEIHRARRVTMAKSGISQIAISDLFQKEAEDALKLQEERNRIIQETQQEKLRLLEEIEKSENDDVRAEVIAMKKFEILQQIQEILKKDEKIYDDAGQLAYYLRKEYFDRIPENSENTVIIIATQKGKLWAFHVQQNPDPIDVIKIQKIDIIMKNED